MPVTAQVTTHARDTHQAMRGVPVACRPESVFGALRMKARIRDDGSARRDRSLAVLLTGVAVLTSLVVAECGLRLRASRSNHAQEVSKIQALLTAHPSLGYLWKSNLSLPVGIVTWADQVPRALTTDMNGFFNPPHRELTP